MGGRTVGGTDGLLRSDGGIQEGDTGFAQQLRGLTVEDSARVSVGEQYSSGLTFRNRGKGREDTGDVQACRCCRDDEDICSLRNGVHDGLIQRGRVNDGDLSAARVLLQLRNVDRRHGEGECGPVFCGGEVPVGC